MELRWTQAARRHRIGRARAKYVMGTCAPTISERPATGEVEFTWVGTDDRGVLLEVVAVAVVPDQLLVLHVMPVYRWEEWRWDDGLDRTTSILATGSESR